MSVKKKLKPRGRIATVLHQDKKWFDTMKVYTGVIVFSSNVPANAVKKVVKKKKKNGTKYETRRLHRAVTDRIFPKPVTLRTFAPSLRTFT
jgi:hypothetical protein